MTTNNTSTNQNLLDEYSSLLLRRDHLFRDAGSYQVMYTAEFGELIAANLELKVACIKEKKTISYCRRRMNRGLAIDVERMQGEIEKEMTLYREQLDEMLGDVERAKAAKTIGQFESSRSKRIYRKLAKLLHPDIFPAVNEDEELRDLWQRIVEAYYRCDVDALEELEIVARAKLKEYGADEWEVEADNLEERIERVERQINDILTTEPYTYCELLHDESKKKAHREELQAEHDEYEAYLAELKKTLEAMLSEGGIKILWNMN